MARTVAGSPPSNSILSRLDQALICYRCLESGHTRRFCCSLIQCTHCLNLGHIQRFCRSNNCSKPMLEWRPKAISTREQPQIQWRPKFVISSQLEVAQKKKEISPINHSLDSRAPAPVFSTFKTDEQEQGNNSSATIPQSVPDFSTSPPRAQGKPSFSPSSPPHSPPSSTEKYNSTADNPPVDPSVGAKVGAMANYLVNPQAFLVAGLTVNHGWNRPARGRMALGGEPTREHEDFTIVSLNPMPEDINQLRPHLNVVCNYLEQSQRVSIESAFLSPWVLA